MLHDYAVQIILSFVDREFFFMAAVSRQWNACIRINGTRAVTLKTAVNSEARVRWLINLGMGSHIATSWLLKSGAHDVSKSGFPDVYSRTVILPHNPHCDTWRANIKSQVQRGAHCTPTAFIQAAVRGSVEDFKWLISLGQRWFTDTVFEATIASMDRDLILFVVKEFIVDWGCTFCVMCCSIRRNQGPEMLELLMQIEVKPCANCVPLAAELWNRKTVDYLLSAHHVLCIMNGRAVQSLFINAARRGEVEFFQSLRRKYPHTLIPGCTIFYQNMAEFQSVEMLTDEVVYSEVQFIAGRGDVEKLKRIFTFVDLAIYSDFVYSTAAKKGQIDVMNFLYSRGFVADISIVTAAVERENIDVLIWLKQHGGYFNVVEVTNAVARTGSVEMFDYLIECTEGRTRFSKNTMQFLVESGRADPPLMERYCAAGCPFRVESMTYIFRNESFKTIRWILAKRRTLALSEIREASAWRTTEEMAWLCEFEDGRLN